MTGGDAQNVLNVEEERKKEEEKVLREIEETEEKYPTWSGKFEKTNDAVTLVKGYFQQWIPTPDNYRSLLTVILSVFKEKCCGCMVLAIILSCLLGLIKLN